MKKLFTILCLAAVSAMDAQIVINEVYGGGGNSGATLKNDFIELYNRGTAPVTLSNAYIQYGSATGSFGGTQSTVTIYALPATFTIEPGKYYLIGCAAGAGGTADLPTADANIAAALGATSGKVALTTSATPITSATDASVIDYVAYGPTASPAEGAGPAPAPSATNSISRTNGVDTNNNKTDFTAGTPSPTNSSMMLATSEASALKANLIKNTVATSTILFGAKSDVKIYSVNGQLVKFAAVNAGTSLDVSSLAKGIYIVTGEVNGQKVSQKIIKN